MITSIFGRRFLSAYNKKYGTDYDAKTFFIEKFYPLFFNHEKYMIWAKNSPFVQMKKGQRVDILSSEERHEKLVDFIKKVNDGARDDSIAPGYPASDAKEFATTSGQVSNIHFNISQEDIYCSWFGVSLAVCVQGGLYILFENDEILLDIYEGWGKYRETLNSIPELKGYKVVTWNGQWLAHKYSYMYDEINPFANFDPYKTESGAIAIETQSWVKLLFGISKKYNDRYSKILGYIFRIDKTNSTVGFIQFDISGIRRLQDLYVKWFRVESGRLAEDLWNTEFGFSTACKAGVIGIRALEPKGLRKYIYGEEKRDLKFFRSNTDNKGIINFNIYKIWIMAMLNNESLWDKSDRFAKLLYDYAISGERAKTVNSRKVDSVLKTTNRQKFIESLIEIIEDSEHKDGFKEIAQTIDSMPSDNVPYFLTLIRFNYALRCY